MIDRSCETVIELFKKLKSVHFKNKLRKSSFFQNCGTFCFDLYWKHHIFKRNKIRATDLLKWTNFTTLDVPAISTENMPNFVLAYHY